MYQASICKSIIASLSLILLMTCGLCCTSDLLAAPAGIWQEEATEEQPGENSGENSEASGEESAQEAEEQQEEAKPDEQEAEGTEEEPSEEQAEEEQAEEEQAEEAQAKDNEEDSDKRRSRSNRRPRQPSYLDNSRGSQSFLKVFRPIIADTAAATVQIKKGSRSIALGAIVDPAGYVLTKQSELRSPLTCELADGTELPARVYGVHPETDLALLKIDPPDDNPLPVVRWAETDTLDVGDWLATVQNDEQPLAVGVVGVKARVIRPQAGFMGVNLRQMFDDDQKPIQVEVTGVTSDSPAQEGGIKEGDVIVEVNDETFTEIDKLITKVQSYPPGEEIRLTLLRNGKEIIADVVLGEAESLNPLYERSRQQNTMGGNILSKRRQDFPLAVQHDALIKPEQCGGPVVNLEGEVVGINIARQGRVSSLMLPASLIMPIVNDLKSGQRTPAEVNRARIAEINRMLEELNTVINLSPLNNDSLKDQLEQYAADEEEAEKRLQDALDDLKKITKEKLRVEIAMSDAEERYENAQKEIERLEHELEQLVSGTR
ncbi:MAG: trypsin-like peptidase domain-containing protein [Pirellulaceae bacterium]